MSLNLPVAKNSALKLVVANNILQRFLLRQPVAYNVFIAIKTHELQSRSFLTKYNNALLYE